MAKYKLAKSGWLIPSVNYRASGIWKCILSVKFELDKWICYRAHNWQNISFWNDVWCGLLSLKQWFVALYLLDRRPSVVIVENYNS